MIQRNPAWNWLNSNLSPLRHDPAAASSAPSCQKILRWSAEWVDSDGEKVEEGAGRDDRVGREQLGLSRVVQRGSLPFPVPATWTLMDCRILCMGIVCVRPSCRTRTGASLNCSAIFPPSILPQAFPHACCVSYIAVAIRWRRQRICAGSAVFSPSGGEIERCEIYQYDIGHMLLNYLLLAYLKQWEL